MPGAGPPQDAGPPRGGAPHQGPPPPPPRRPLTQGPEFVTASSGSGAFRALNFELYTVGVREDVDTVPVPTRREGALSPAGATAATKRERHRFVHERSLTHTHTYTHTQHPHHPQKPTGVVRLLSFAGTAVALGVVGYWYWETEHVAKQKKQQAASAERRL